MPKFNIRISDSERQIIHLSKQDPRHHLSNEVSRLLLEYEHEFDTSNKITFFSNERDNEGSIFTCLRLSADAFDALKRIEARTGCKPTQIIKAAIYRRKGELEQNNHYTDTIREIRKKMQEIEQLLLKLEAIK